MAAGNINPNVARRSPLVAHPSPDVNFLGKRNDVSQDKSLMFLSHCSMPLFSFYLIKSFIASAKKGK
jgi:hypothetical protein